MPAPLPSFDRHAQPVGPTPEAQRRNAALLAEYAYDKYVSALTGYTGQDLQRIAAVRWQEAVRTRVGPRGNYKAGMTQLPDGRLMLASCRQYPNDEPGKAFFGIQAYTSEDVGLTWQALEHTPLFGKEPALTALPDGTLVMTAQRLDQGPSAVNDTIYVARSEDGGRTWEVREQPGTDYPRRILVEPDGSLLYIRALHEDWANSGKGCPHLELLRSADGGGTWRSTEGHVDWDYQAFGEVCALRLRDGRLLAALRRQMPGTEGEGFEDTVLTESTDDGRTWCA
ncbi:MAG: exo-alpha-sialidase, partial [Chloroflexi bacterium]|nr:exo-alpha-sialidase [Chloroflexota bacterium]